MIYDQWQIVVRIVCVEMLAGDEKEILLKKKRMETRKGNIHAGFAYVNPEWSGVEWRDPPQRKRSVDGKMENGDESSHPDVGEEFKKKRS